MASLILCRGIKPLLRGIRRLSILRDSKECSFGFKNQMPKQAHLKGKE